MSASGGKQLAMRFARVDDEYYTVVLRCGHAPRFHRSVVDKHDGRRKWYVCEVCARIHRDQAKFNFAR